MWGSGVAGAACALLAMLTGNYSLWQVGMGNAALYVWSKPSGWGAETSRLCWLWDSVALLRQEHRCGHVAL